jgi:hypothetical protein
MDTLISVIISGMAVGYLVEMLSMLFSQVVSRLAFALPLNLLVLWFMPIYPLVTFITSALAAAFFGLVIIRLFDKPIVVDQRRRL